MAKYASLQTFYASDIWRNFRMYIINLRGLACEHCSKRVAKADEVTLHHHRIELTPDNVHDSVIALNPDNVMVVHHACHNQIHRHGARRIDRQAFVVFGAPLSGKHSFVRDRMWPGDLIVDMDLLYAAATMLPCYDKPDSVLNNVKGLYNLLLDNVKTRCGRWDRAWIIGGYPDRYRREQVVSDVGGELVFIQATREQCIERLTHDEGRGGKVEEWTRYIDRWFEVFATYSGIPPG